MDEEDKMDDQEFEYEFKQAVIKAVKSLPEIMRALNDHTKAMDEFRAMVEDYDWPSNKTIGSHIEAMNALTRAITTMPHSLR